MRAGHAREHREGREGDQKGQLETGASETIVENQ